MIDALYIAASGLRSEQKQIDVISNNVANMQTPGFKRSRVNFAEVATSPGSTAQTGYADAAGGGARVASTTMQFTPGDFRATRNPLDVAVDGEGFFELQAPDGTLLYTRDGQFRLNEEGYLVSSNGMPLSRQVQIPAGATDLRIAENGTVSALLAGDTDRSELGTIELAKFAATDMLTGRGDNMFGADDAAGAPTYGQASDPGFGQIKQGFVELSNVEMIDEMSALVIAQRAYQLNARLLQASDQVLETINNLRR